MTDRRALPDGYSEVPPGKLAAVVTCLEMRKPAPPRPERSVVPWQLRRVQQPRAQWYRELFARVGSEWLWFSRLVMPTAELDVILGNAAIELYTLTVNGRDEGLLELDFRIAGECELAFYGLTDSVQGQGAGRWLMNRALERAWSRPIERFWVHTCSNDHPHALGFYLRSGFHPYARRVEVADDPRVGGLLPRTAAPHVPLIIPR